LGAVEDADRLFAEQHELVRRRDGQRPEDDGIEQAEDRRVPADPQREREDGYRSESGVAPE